MDKAREKFVAEIKRMEEVVSRTQSLHLKADYEKAIRKMKKELKIYDDYHKN